MRYYISFLLLLFLGKAYAQTTFNKRVHFGHPSAVLTGVIATDSFYYSTGVVADTLPQNLIGNIFTKIDLEGNPVFHKVITAPDKTYATWEDCIMLEGETIALAGYSYDSIPKGFIMEFDLFGDTLLYSEYSHPFWPNYDFMLPIGGLQEIENGGFIVCNNLRNGPTSIDIYIIRTDMDGVITWDSIYSLPYLDAPKAIVPDANGGFIIGAWTVNQQLVLENFTSQTYILNIDNNGQLLWQYNTPSSLGLRGGANEMVLLDDGSLVVASGIGTEVDLGPSHVIYFEKLLFKLSPEHELEWELKIPDFDLNGSSDLTSVIAVSDGSGFVVGGRHGEEIAANYTFAIRGDISKVSNDGQLVWTRRYVGIDSDEPTHQVYDLKETADGGFIIVGESRDGTGDTYPSQQAWLLKLDQHGCLVPGCHLLDDVDEKIENPLQLSIYPNPTTDYLNFQLRSSGILKNGTFHIINANGQLVKEFQMNVRAGDTFVVPVWDWPGGVYFLQYLDRSGKARLSEKFIISKH